METSLRLILLLLGFVILAGIIWDFRRNKDNKKRKKTNLQREPHDFNDELLFDESALIDHEHSVKNENKEINKNKKIMVMHVMAKSGNFSGGRIFDAFNEVHLYYGDMQIFYRHENIDGTGNIVFSVVSAVEPGYFEISKMEKFVTPGITLFFTLTRPNQSIAAFELMLRTAKQLALHLNGEVRDEHHHVLTAQTIEEYREQVRKLPIEFGAAMQAIK